MICFLCIYIYCICYIVLCNHVLYSNIFKYNMHMITCEYYTSYEFHVLKLKVERYRIYHQLSATLLPGMRRSSTPRCKGLMGIANAPCRCSADGTTKKETSKQGELGCICVHWYIELSLFVHEYWRYLIFFVTTLWICKLYINIMNQYIIYSCFTYLYLTYTYHIISYDIYTVFAYINLSYHLVVTFVYVVYSLILSYINIIVSCIISLCFIQWYHLICHIYFLIPRNVTSSKVCRVDERIDANFEERTTIEASRWAGKKVRCNRKGLVKPENIWWYCWMNKYAGNL